MLIKTIEMFTINIPLQNKKIGPNKEFIFQFQYIFVLTTSKNSKLAQTKESFMKTPRIKEYEQNNMECCSILRQNNMFYPKIFIVLQEFFTSEENVGSSVCFVPNENTKM